MAQLPRVELTLLMGAHAQKWTLGERWPGSVDAAVRRWRDWLPRYVVLPHPSWRNNAWLARNPWFEAQVTAYLRRRVGQILQR